MAQRFSVALTIALICLLSASARAELTSTHSLELTFQAGGDVDVEETISLQGDWSSAALTRSFWLQAAQAAWPLRQSLQNVSVRTAEGHDLDYRVRGYEDRANIDFVEVPESGVLVLRYRVHRALDFLTGQVNWQWTVSGYGWKAAITEVRIELNHPDTPAAIDSQFAYHVGYSDENAHQNVSADGGESLFWKFQPQAQPDEPISISVDVITGSLGPAPASWFWQDLARLVQIPLIAFLLLVLLAMPLILLRPAAVVAVTSVSNFVPGVPAMIAAFGATRYWYFEQGHRSAGDDLSGEFIVNFGLAGFVLLFAWKQRRVLRQGIRAAYFSQLAFPAVLLIAWPIAFVDRSMLIFPLLAFPCYLYWPRRKVALEFGVGAHRIAEEVGGRGEATVSELAGHFRITPDGLLKALQQNPHLPIVVDHKRQVVLSAEAAALHEELRVCTYCGGGTETLGMAVRKCGFCDREYTSSMEHKADKPLPLVIETLAIFFETLAIGLCFLAGTIAIAILVMDTVAGDVVEGLIGGASSGGIVCIPAVLSWTLASGLRLGKGLGTTQLLLLCCAWLIVPLVVLWKLRSRRVRIFAGTFDVGEISTQLADKGEWSLSEFADYLQSNQEDAAELAQYLAVNQIIDVVYDRRAGRLVNRSLYRDIAAEGSCHRCGGFFGVQQGRATCHYCGASDL